MNSDLNKSLTAREATACSQCAGAGEQFYTSIDIFQCSGFGILAGSDNWSEAVRSISEICPACQGSGTL